MTDKDIEKHAVAGSEKERREYLKVFEGELWIRHDDCRRECKESQRLGEARYREANRSQLKQIFNMLTQRGGATPSMMKWAVELEIDKESCLVTDETFEGVIEHAYKLLKGWRKIDE